MTSRQPAPACRRAGASAAPAGMRLRGACARSRCPVRRIRYTRTLEGLCITCHKVRGQPVGSGGRAGDVPARRSHGLRRRVDKRCTEAADKCRRPHCTTATRAVRFLAPDHGSMPLKRWAHLTVSCPLPVVKRGTPRGVRHRKALLCGAAANPHGRYARAWEQTYATLRPEYALSAGGGCRPCRRRYGRRS
jgi:hypothetical protein